MTSRVCSPIGLISTLVVAAASCTSVLDGSFDASFDASISTSYAPAAPIAPAPAAPPMLTPCPQGWGEADGGVCEPWPSGRSTTCGNAEAQWPGALQCERVGSECPSGDWPTNLPTNVPVLYVRAGAAGGGNGTQSAPYRSVATAASVATAGTIISVAKGVYSNELVVLKTRVTIWGACAAQVQLSVSTFDNTSAIVNVIGPGNVMRDVTVSGARPGIWIDGATASLDVHGVVVRDATLAGVLVRAGAALTGDALVIRHTRPQTSTGVSGRGLSVELGGRVTLERAAIENNTDYGALVMDSTSSLTLTEASITGTASRAFDGRGGQGLAVLSQSSAALTSTVLEANHECGAFANGGGRLVATDLVVRDSEASTADPDTGFGAVITKGGSMKLERALFERNHGYGIFAENAGVTLELTDVVIRDTAPSGPGIEGGGIGVAGTAQVTLNRVALERNVAFGLMVQEAGTSVTSTDLSVRNTLALPNSGSFGIGVEVSRGASLQATRVLVAGNRTVGILADKAGTHLAVNDAEVKETLPEGVSDEFGFGMSIQEGAHAEANRVSLIGNRVAGLIVSDQGSELTVTDLAVRDTSGRLREGDFGRGVHVQTSALVSMTRVALENNREVGLHAQRAEVTAHELLIRDTRSSTCASNGCPSWGDGLAALDKASVVLERFLITSSAEIGIQFSNDASVDLAIGEVSWNPIAVNIHGEYDVSRLERDVVYRNNGRKLVADFVPLPTLPIAVSPTASPR